MKAAIRILTLLLVACLLIALNGFSLTLWMHFPFDKTPNPLGIAVMALLFMNLTADVLVILLVLDDQLATPKEKPHKIITPIKSPKVKTNA